MKVVKIGADIGGVLSKYPEQWRPLVNLLSDREGCGVEVHILTDMPWEKAKEALALNSIRVPPSHIHSCDYATHGEGCKAEKAREIGIDILIDDHPAYVSLPGLPMVRLLVMPDPAHPYYAGSWNVGASEGSTWGRAAYRSP